MDDEFSEPLETHSYVPETTISSSVDQAGHEYPDEYPDQLDDQCLAMNHSVAQELQPQDDGLQEVQYWEVVTQRANLDSRGGNPADVADLDEQIYDLKEYQSGHHQRVNMMLQEMACMETIVETSSLRVEKAEHHFLSQERCQEGLHLERKVKKRSSPEKSPESPQSADYPLPSNVNSEYFVHEMKEMENLVAEATIHIQWAELGAASSEEKMRALQMDHDCQLRVLEAEMQAAKTTEQHAEEAAYLSIEEARQNEMHAEEAVCRGSPVVKRYVEERAAVARMEQQLTRSKEDLCSLQNEATKMREADEQLARALSNEDDMKKRLERSEAERHKLEQEAERLRSALKDALQICREEPQIQERKISNDSTPSSTRREHNLASSSTIDQTPPQLDSLPSRMRPANPVQETPHEPPPQLDSRPSRERSTEPVLVTPREPPPQLDSRPARMRSANTAMLPMETLHELTPRHEREKEPNTPLPPPDDGPPFTPKEGWVLKLSKGLLRWNKRWMKITGQYVVLSRTSEGVGSKALAMEGLDWQPLKKRQIAKMHWWLRSKTAFAFILIPKEQKDGIGPCIISVGSRVQQTAWTETLDAARRMQSRRPLGEPKRVEDDGDGDWV